jgi:U3 small nucleolar RNA-associated protein 12
VGSFLTLSLFVLELFLNELLARPNFSKSQIIPAMVKTYSKYELSQTFGLVTSALSNVVSISDSGTRLAGPGVAVVGANEEVLTWDVKKGELLSKWKDEKSNSQVTAIARSSADPDIFAAG